MRVTEVVPALGVAHDPSSPEGREWLEAVYARNETAYVRLNMITSVTGSAAGGDGTSETLTSRVDRAILGIIRAHADVVVVGAATVRAEGYLLPRSTTLAVVTASGDLRGHRFSDDGASLLLVCPIDRAEAVRERAGLRAATVVGIGGGDDLAPASIVAELTSRGYPRIVCEGGPTLAGRFAAAGVIDEYCVTVAPVLEPATHPFLPLGAGAALATDPAGMLVDDAAFSYLRLRTRS